MRESLSCLLVLLGCLFLRGSWGVAPSLVTLPNFRDLARFYPGYWHHGGRYHNHQLLALVGPKPRDRSLLLHDTSALRLSYALNRIGGPHSLGRQLIRLSKFGHDSVAGSEGLEYIFHPIAYGPFLADRYGYPSVSKLHAQDPVSTKENFWGRQGILRVITYTQKRNMPKGHVALWDCNHFHQSKDWVAGHSLLTVEFWEAPDSNCSTMDSEPRYLRHSADLSGGSPAAHHPSREDHRPPSLSPSVPLVVEASRPHPKLRHKHWERQFLAHHHVAQFGGDGQRHKQKEGQFLAKHHLPQLGGDGQQNAGTEKQARRSPS